MHTKHPSPSAFGTPDGAKRRSIERIADRQRRLITTSQAIGCGVSRRGIARRLESRTFGRAYRGVYLVGASELTEPRRRLGLCLAYGGDAALTGRASLDGWDFTRFTRKRRSEPLEVVTSTPRRLRISDAEHHVLRRFSADHRVWHGGEWVASVLWTITDLGTSLTPHQLANVLHEAAFHHRVALEDVERVLQVRGPFPGARTVRRAIKIARSGSAGTRSFSEDQFLIVAKFVTKLEPVVNTPRQFGSEWIEPDFVWLRERVIIELDGGQHGSTRHSSLSDTARDAAYRAAGFTVIRISSRAVWEQPGAVANRLARALGVG